jgi:hypothetical protein
MNMDEKMRVLLAYGSYDPSPEEWELLEAEGVKYICPRCGSNNVFAYAEYAQWDDKTRSWSGFGYDFGYDSDDPDNRGNICFCRDCDRWYPVALSDTNINTKRRNR